MKTSLHHLQENEKNIRNSRREFIEKGLKLTVVSGVASLGLLAGCKEEGEEKEVSPPEDLMQEHGLLNRILLIYDQCKTNLINKQSFDMTAILNSAGIIRTFVEDYHEKQEENYLFPRFKKARLPDGQANQLTDLVDVLLQQHQAGRNITDQITQITK